MPRLARATALKPFIYEKFKGMNRINDRMNMPPEYDWNLRNGYLDKAGAVTQRDGITKLNTTGIDGSPKVRCIFEARWNSGAKDKIVRAGTAWHKYNSTTSAFDSIDASRTSDAYGMAAMCNNYLMMVDGGHPRKMTEAGVVTDLSTDANLQADASAIHLHRNKVWVNSAANPLYAYYSNTDDPFSADSFTPGVDAGKIDLSSVLPTGDRIIGYKTFAEVYLVIICLRHIVVYDAGPTPSQFRLIQIIPVGCLSPYAVDQVGNDMVVPGYQGLNPLTSARVYKELDIDDLTRWIAPLYRTYVSSTTTLTDITGIFNHTLNHYYINFPLASKHRMFVYSLDHKNIVGHWDGFNVWSFGALEDGTVYIGGEGYVYELNSGSNDDGVAINFEWEKPYLYFKTRNLYKSLREVEFPVTVENADATLNFDYQHDVDGAIKTKQFTASIIDAKYSHLAASPTDPTTVPTDPLTLYRVAQYRGTASYVKKNNNLTGRGKMTRVKIWHSTLNAKITIPHFILRVWEEGIL